MRWPAMATAVLLSALGGCAKQELRACKPARSYWVKPHNFLGLLPISTSISIDRIGAIYWNGEKVSRAQFESYLREARKLENPAPEFFLEAEMGAPCATLDEVRDRMDDVLQCKAPNGHCAEGIRAIWRALPTPPGMIVS